MENFKRDTGLLVKELKELLDPSYCSIYTSYTFRGMIEVSIKNPFSNQSYLISFINAPEGEFHNALKLPSDIKSKKVYESPNQTIVFDLNFENLDLIMCSVKNGEDSFLNKKVDSMDQYKFKKIYEVFSLLSNYCFKKKIKNLKINYNQLFFMKLFSDIFNQKEDFKRYIFMFSPQEFRFRHNNEDIDKLVLEEMLVKIKDTSAFFIEDKHGTFYLDHDLGIFYKDKKYIYLDQSITERIEVSKDKEYDLVSYSKNEEPIYYKTCLKKGVDLSKIDKRSYYKAYNMVFKLKKSKDFYFLFDLNGNQIPCHHSDLELYVLGKDPLI